MIRKSVLTIRRQIVHQLISHFLLKARADTHVLQSTGIVEQAKQQRAY